MRQKKGFSTRYGLKVLMSFLAITLAFGSIYQVAFALTYGEGLFKTAATGAVAAPAPAPAAAAQVAAVPATKAKGSAATEATFTAQELARFTGQNGTKAYVAVEGIVYDMTALGSWKNGKHQGLSAGTDLTAAFAQSPHTKSILKKVKVVGKLVASKAAAPAAAAAVAPAAKADAVAAATGAQKSETVKPAAKPVVAAAGTAKATQTSTWTLAALKQYNGTKGNPAYIAINGTIYDVSDWGAWSGGTHHGVRAGTDVTKAFANSPHAMSMLKGVPVVGQLGQLMSEAPAVGVAQGAAKGTVMAAGFDDNGKDHDDDDEDDDDDDDDDHDDDDDDEDEDDEDDEDEGDDD